MQREESDGCGRRVMSVMGVGGESEWLGKTRENSDWSGKEEKSKGEQDDGDLVLWAFVIWNA